MSDLFSFLNYFPAIPSLIALQVNNWNEGLKENETLISILKNAKTYITIEIDKEKLKAKHFLVG